MAVEVPPFDTDALRDNAAFAVLPIDPSETKRVFDALVADQIAAADHIDLLTFVLRGQEAA